MFVTLEGIDGSGKTSVAQRLPPLLPGRELVLTHEPTDGHTGKAVKDALARGAPPLETLFLFIADRAGHAPGIEEASRSGKIVVCDRYHDSTVAYQSVAIGQLPGVDDLLGFLRGFARHFPTPDLTVLLKADPAACMKRLTVRGPRIPYEKEEFITHVQQVYLQLARGDPRFVVVDAEQKIDELAKQVAAAIGSRAPAGQPSSKSSASSPVEADPRVASR
jgi:dTMP kinase